MTALLDPVAPSATILPLEVIGVWKNYREEHADNVDTLAADMMRRGYSSAYPLEVVRDPDTPGRYLVAAGHHRRAAAIAAGLLEVPAVVHEGVAPGSRAFFRVQLRENLTRRQSNPLEEGLQLAAMVENGATLEDLQDCTGHGAAWVTSRLELAGLHPLAQSLAVTRGYGIRWAVLLADLEHETQATLCRLLGDASTMSLEGWRQTVDRARREENERRQTALFDGGAFTLEVEEWSTTLGAYVAEGESLTVDALEATDTTPLGLAEIATRLGVARATAYKWQARGLLPAPDLALAMGPLWHAGTVDRWARETGRTNSPAPLDK